MATAAVTPDKDAIVCEIHIAARPERVFQALIDPQQVLLWWISEESQIEAFALEPKRGGRWVYDSKESKLNVNGVSKFHCEGEVLEFDPPRVLAYTWIANWHGNKNSRSVSSYRQYGAGEPGAVLVNQAQKAELRVRQIA